MANPVAAFGETAKGLSRNPLGIIALFIVLVYGFACLVVGVGKTETGERLPLIWFLVVFPVMVLGVFAWLVSCHHKKLYAPTDYKDEAHFVATINPDLKKLSVAKPPKDIPSAGLESLTASNNEEKVADINPDRAAERSAIYEQCRGLFVTHVLYPSEEATQEFDIFIYLIRHKSSDFDDIVQVDFFFGHYWGNRVFKATKIRGLFGVRTSAYGPFLSTCRVLMKDGSTISLHRYIDFEMGRALAT
ncbi:MAG TPA: pYEATS domain-containing protein [Urbifossiella sp.]|nr:pYEATS domain-containing protein [Urbifossiella sp.]